jgi:hypothetical protein
MSPRLKVLALASALIGIACAGITPSPASRSPIKERLASLGDGELEDLSRACFEKAGWKPDSFPSIFGGGASKRLRATKKGEETAVYLYPSGTVPRITGGPEWSTSPGSKGDPFWDCLEGQPH